MTDPLQRAGVGSRRTVCARLDRILSTASPADVAAGSEFYPTGRTIALDLGMLYAERLAPYGYDLTDHRAYGAAILAAFSPRQRWSVNVSNAYAYAADGRMTGVPAVRTMLAEIHTAAQTTGDPVGAITRPSRPKVSAFARNIAGDLDPVTVDSWAAWAACPYRDPAEWLPRAGVYAAVASTYRTVAFRHGLEPATAQAIVWTAVRTQHGPTIPTTR